MMLEIIYVTLILLHITLNLIVTLLISKHRGFSSFKKTGMTILLWLVPVLGFIWVWIMLKDKNYGNSGTNNDATAYEWFGSGSDGGGSDGGGGSD